jgi:hypothetical protein
MAHLIVGHTTHHSTRIWVHDEKSWTCRIALSATERTAGTPPDPKSQRATLSRARNRTATAVFTVRPATEYDVIATFDGTFGSTVATGRVRTLDDPDVAGTAIPFSFVLASCNLSVAAVNNLLAYLLVGAGAAAAAASFDLPLSRWNVWRWLAFLLRWFGKITLIGAAWVVRVGNRARQPSRPQLRSPFLKLDAVFDAHVVELEEANMEDFPAAGDRIGPPAKDDTIGGHGGSGHVVSVEKITREQNRRREEERNQRRRGRRYLRTPSRPAAGDPDQDRQVGTCTLVVTHVRGTFEQGQAMTIEGRKRVRVRVRRARRAKPWYAPPAFFILAGVDIYADFPDPDLEPARKAYRRAYQEAWFDDASAAHVLAHWPHYMTLDDHEIADQFANNFTPRNKTVHRDRYADEALAAYNEYVTPRNPPSPGIPSANGRPAYWYKFNHGRAYFFVLDTRTRRDTSRGEMVDADQLNELLRWLTDVPANDLKFVVTSVPFVAEFVDDAADKPPDWFHGRNPDNDKWSARSFKHQRTTIIEYIHRHRIEHVVFLTGDMHCCYHALMRIGPGSKYSRVAVHELGSGPLNQLQLPNLSEFRTLCTGTTRDDAHGSAVEYEVTLEQFHSQVSAVLQIAVDYGPDPHNDSKDAVRPILRWNVIRTVTDVGVEAWSSEERDLVPRIRRDWFAFGGPSVDENGASLTPLGRDVGQEPVRFAGETTPHGRLELASGRSATHPQWW